MKKTSLEKVLEHGLMIKKRWSFFYNPGTFREYLVSASEEYVANRPRRVVEARVLEFHYDQG